MFAIVGCDRPTKPPVAARLAFDVQPANAVAGSAIVPQVRVRVIDASGNTFTGAVTVTLTLAHANGASLRGTASVASVDGVATFRDLRIEKAATGYLLEASAGSLSGATSNPFDVTHAPPAKLRFVDQPTATTAGRPIAPAITIEVTDEFDNRATSATTAVTLGIAAGAAAVVVGTTSVDAVSGIATFDKITLNRGGTFSLSATATGLAPATSAPFDVQLAALTRFCAAEAASGAAFGRLDDAIAATQPGGTVVLCDGVHAVNGAVVDKPLSIVGEHDGLAIVGNTTASALVVNGVTSGTVRIAGLVFDVGHTSAILATGVYDEVVVERSTFRTTAPATASVTAVRAGPRTSLTGRVMVGTSAATGFAEAIVADPLARLDLSDSEIRSSSVNGVRYLAGASGVIQRNRITNCGRDACINVAPGAGGLVEILDNQLTNEGTAQTFFGILLSGRTTIRRNRIIGPRGDPSYAPAYGQTSHTFKASAIALENSTRGIPVVIEGNEITGALTALQVYNDLSQITARDNRIRRVGTVVSLINDTGAPVFERNDVVEFAGAIGLTRPPAGSFRCNWWGRPMGPIGEEYQFAPPPVLWHPASATPIAGQPAVACDVTAPMPPTRFCPPEFSTGRAWPTLAAAISATADDGTVIVCDGRYPAAAYVRQSVRLVAEHPHAATFIAEEPSSIVLNFADGIGTVRDLNFEAHDGAALAGAVVAENNRFTVTGTGTAVSITGGPSAVRNNTFTGGGTAIFAYRAGGVEIRDNTISSQVVQQTIFSASIDLGFGGRYVVRNNTIDGCALRCIQARVSQAEIVGNTLRTSVGRGTTAGIELDGGAVIVQDNVVEGQGTVADRADGSAYAFTTAGIIASDVPSPAFGDSAAIVGNAIANARSAIWIDGRRTTTRDNAVRHVRWAVEVTGFLDRTVERNDFTDFVDAFRLPNAAPYQFAICNYWGSATGPTTTESSSYYTPFSAVPIAKQPSVKCP